MYLDWDGYTLLLLVGQFFTGLAGGFADELKGHRERVREREAKRQEQELSILQLLAGADDEDIQRMALTGLLQAGQPGKRAKGIRGFLDETEDTPVSQSLRQIQELMRTPVEREVTRPGIPARPVTGSAALQAQAAVEPGATVPDFPAEARQSEERR